MRRASSAFTSSTDRPLSLRMRADLIVESQRYLGRDYWIVKDPIGLKYYRFEEEEFALLQMLDGHTSLEQMKRRFESRFAPQRIEYGELHRFLGSLYRNCLLISSGRQQGQQILERAHQSSKRRRFSALSNLMAVRFRGVDPNRFLTGLNRYVGWMLSVPMVAVGLLVMIGAALLIVVQYEQFAGRLPAFEQFFAVRNWLWLAGTLAVTKVLHELGHGIACKRLGGDCHEMGVMFLVFTPCLYCNVSDAWMLPSKWHRAAIAAAGIHVELLLASICTFIWWFTVPGALNYICLNVMFVCSLSTVLFNANPLLRYDGYYILSDLIEIPNLRQKANATVRGKLGALIAGLPLSHDPFLPAKRRWLFALYAIAAACYRWVIVFSIFWFVYRMMEPYGLKIVGQLLALTALYSLIVAPIIQLVRFFQVPGRVQRVKPLRVLTSIGVVGACVTGLLMIPLPYWIEVPAYVQPATAETVYVDVAGTVQTIHVAPGDEIEQGAPIVTLSNRQLAESIMELEGQIAIERAKAQNALLIEAYDPTIDAHSHQLEQGIATLERRLAKYLEKQQLLTVRAPNTGMIFPAPYVSRAANDTEHAQLQNWDGNPLDEKNVGGLYTGGTMVCRVGDDRRFEVVLAVDQEQVESLRAGLDVRVQLRQSPTNIVSTRIDRIANSKMQAVPRGLAGENGGPLMTKVNARGEMAPLNPTYQVSCDLGSPDHVVQDGAIGTARIRVGDRTIGWRVWRWSMRTFNFEL